MTKKILIVVFSAIILAGLTLLFNLENEKVGTRRYYRIEYTEVLEKSNDCLLLETSTLAEKLAAFQEVYQYTKLANVLEESSDSEAEDSKELSNKEQAIVKVFTSEKLKQTIRYAELALEDYDQSTEVDAVLASFKAEVAAANEYVASLEKEVSLTEGVIYSVFCMVIVFAILILLWFIIESFKFLNNAPSKKVEEENKVAPTQEAKPLHLEDITDPDMMVAALVATIDYSNSGARDVKLVNIKEVVE